MLQNQKKQLKDAMKKHLNPINEDNRETYIFCPQCDGECKHSSKYSNEIPKHYRTYYCERCSNLIYSDSCIRKIK